MQEDFKLETILSVVTNVNCADDFYDIYELLWFIFENPVIDDKEVLKLKQIARNHILKIHPELKSIKFNENDSINSWVLKQKCIYGDELTISVFGEPIVKLTKKSYHSYR